MASVRRTSWSLGRRVDLDPSSGSSAPATGLVRGRSTRRACTLRHRPLMPPTSLRGFASSLGADPLLDASFRAQGVATLPFTPVIGGTGPTAPAYTDTDGGWARHVAVHVVSVQFPRASGTFNGAYAVLRPNGCRARRIGEAEASHLDCAVALR